MKEKLKKKARKNEEREKERKKGLGEVWEEKRDLKREKK